MTARKNVLRGSLCALLGSVLWGFSGTCSQYLFTHKGIESGWLTVVRMLGAGVLLTLLACCTRRQELRGMLKQPRDCGMLVVFGVCGLLVSQYTYLNAVQFSNSGTATVLQDTGPVLIMVVTCILSRRLPNRIEVLAAGLSLTGVFLLATHGDVTTLSISPEGLTWGLLAAVGFMLYTTLPAGLMRRWGNLPVTGVAMLIGGIVFALLQRFWRYSVQLDGEGVLLVAIVVVVGTVASYSLYLQGVKEIGPVRASIISCAEPITATICSTVWMKTAFTPVDLLGFAVILGAVCLLSLKGGTEK